MVAADRKRATARDLAANMRSMNLGSLREQSTTSPNCYGFFTAAVATVIFGITLDGSCLRRGYGGPSAGKAILTNFGFNRSIGA